MKTFWLEKEKSYLRYIDTQVGNSVLVFVHGLGSSSIADFTDVIIDERFRNYRCILIDLPGHGFSDKPQDFRYNLYDHANVIERLLDFLNIKGVTIIGHSLGGTIAVALAQKREDLVSHLIVLEPNLDPGIGAGSKVIASQSEQSFLQKGYKEYLSDLKTGIKDNPGDSLYYGTFSVTDALAVHRSAVGLLIGTVPPQRKVINSLKCPRTYLVSEQNINEVPTDELHALGFKVYVIPRSGHAMMNDNPEDFKNILNIVIQNR